MYTLANPWRWQLFAACTALLAAAPALAEPFELAAQGRLSATGGGAVADGNYPLSIALFDAPSGGNSVFKDFFLAVPVAQGMFTVALGSGDAKLDTAVFANGKPLWVGVTVGGDPELPRVALRKVPFAAHATMAALAADVQCSACIGADDLAKAAVTGDKIAVGAVGANHVSFNWALAESPGGAANFALGANTAKLADKAKQADSASFADEAASAKAAEKAKTLDCTGCVATAHVSDKVPADWVAAGKLAKVATSGAYADLTGGPDLSPFAKLAAANSWKDKQTFGADTDFALNTALNLRLQIAAKDPALCAADTAGLVYFNSTSSTLLFCDGKTFKALAVVGELGTINAPAKNCLEILKAQPVAKSGSYWLKTLAGGSFQAYCNMTDYGGGWTLVLKAGIGLNIASADRTGASDPPPSDPNKPSNDTLYKLSDAAVNALRTSGSGAIGYWVVTPGDGGAIGPYKGAEIFHRDDCTFKMNQNQSQVKSSTCHQWTITYGASPSWNTGFHWNSNDTQAYGWAFGYANTGSCHQDGRDLGAHEGGHAPFHRGWCGSQAWGMVFVR